MTASEDREAQVVEGDKRAVWAVVLFLGNLVAMPVYWYTHIWRQNPVHRVPRSDLRTQGA